MKKIIQVILLLFLIAMSFLLYQKFFKLTKIEKNSVLKPNSFALESKKSITDKKNLIYNLEYKINFDENREYHITAKNSELYSEDNQEIIKLNYVTAILNDEKNIPLKITSKNAHFNDKDYNTKFFGNVKIMYKNDTIISNKANIDFKTKKILIFDDVKYNGLDGRLSADNISVDLNKNKIQIFMNKKSSEVKVFIN